MADQLSSSPFSPDIKTSGPRPESFNANQDEFLIRTMQDDLTSLQNKGHVEQAEIKPKVELPTKEQAIKQETNTSQEFRPVSNSTPFSKQNEKPADIVEVSTFQAEQPPMADDGHTGPVKIIITIIIILIVCILGLGLYYFLSTRSAKKITNQTPIAQPAPIEKTTPAPTETVEKNETASPIEAPVEKYSTEKPNYLTIDMSSQGPEDIKNSIIKISEDIKNSTSTQPYEFIIVDNNNNPVAFPIFATAAKINILPEILSNLGTDFSLFLYNDNSNVRLALSVNIKTKDQLMKSLLNQEKTFPTDASFLFLNNIPEIKTGLFATGSYNNYSVRFLNLTAAKDLSIDYTVTNSQLVIGTSKNTERAVLDDISKTQTALNDNNSNNIQKSEAPAINTSKTSATPATPPSVQKNSTVTSN